MNLYLKKDISHDQNLAINICQGLRPEIFEDTPKLLADFIMKCWDAKAENRPSAKELYQILNTMLNFILKQKDGKKLEKTN